MLSMFVSGVPTCRKRTREAIYQRMKTERDREAKEFRAQGAEIAQRIRARAERERTVLIAESQRQSQVLAW